MTKIAGVVFRIYEERNKEFDKKDDQLYYYKIPPKMKIKVGDFLLVQIKQSTRKEIVRVETIIKDFFTYECERTANKTYMPKLDELICPLSKLDFTALEEYVKIKERKEKLEKTIDELYKKVSKLKILESIAKEDPQLKELIDEYKSLKEE
ncbi:MAG: hypothetical protein IKH36_01850 [Bacilli bacterium]|nr:hypothetical protein [Bacilli bacterium]